MRIKPIIEITALVILCIAIGIAVYVNIINPVIPPPPAADAQFSEYTSILEGLQSRQHNYDCVVFLKNGNSFETRILKKVNGGIWFSFEGGKVFVKNSEIKRMQKISNE